MLFRKSLIALASWSLVWAVFPWNCGGADKRPVPPAAEKAAAEKRLQEAIDKELREATSSTAGAALARKLIETAANSQDKPVEQFVLLQTAATVAADRENLRLACDAVDRTAEVFEINSCRMKWGLLNRARETTEKPALRLIYLSDCERLIAQSLRDEEFEIARSTAQAGADIARDADQAAKTSAWNQKVAEVKALIKEFEQVKAARKLLASEPANEAAQLRAGKFACFVQGDWEAGLSHLEVSGDRELAALAEREQEITDRPALHVQIADAWWEYGQRHAGILKNNILGRAKLHYEKSLNVTSGLDHAHVSGRLNELAALTPSGRLRAPAGQIVNSIGLKLVRIKAGDFTMGSSGTERTAIPTEARKLNLAPWYYDRVPFEWPPHPVRFSKTIYMGKYEVTQVDFRRVMGKSSKTSDPDPQIPAHNVNWAQANEFCKKLSELPEEKAKGRTYRLPTEAEWEFACRAGSADRFPFGKDAKQLGDYAWYVDTSEKKLHPVGEKRANELGLHDMLGNVEEWCSDWFKENTYKDGDGKDPGGPGDGHGRVTRGGSYEHNWLICRSAARNYYDPAATGTKIGFRVVAELK